MSGERNHVVVHVDAATLAHDDPAGRCHLDDGPALHPETARRLACDASLSRIVEADGQPLSLGRKTRTIPPALRRALHSRDGGCRFPGCTHTRFVDAHHIEHWACGGPTNLDNLLLLCRHHHRLLHEGGYTLEARSSRRLRFCRPDGREIPPVPKRRRGDHHQLARRNRARRIDVDAETAASCWNGDPLDLRATTHALCEADHHAPPERGPPAPAR